ncbi:MAG: DUF4328 domain-containing protein [Planifilum fimeticola]
MDLFTRRPAGAVKLLLIIHAVLLFAGLYAHLSTYRLYSEMPELYWHLPHPARDVQQFVVLAQLCSFFITAISFLLWTYRSYRNLSALSDRDLRFSPGWAVGWYFVPIMNLFRPFQVMKEIWEGSAPDADHSRPEEGKGRPVSPLLPGWWSLWLLSNFLAGVPVVRPMDPGESALYMFLTDIVDIPLCFVTFFLVRAIDQRQTEKRALPERQIREKARAFP